jgi:O-antigen ligase
LVGAAVLAPLLAWLGPLAFAVLVLFAALIWAAVSTTWSPFHPKHPQDGAIVKLAFELPLYWSAICAARRADPRLARLALRILAWGFAALGLVLIADVALGAAIYRTLHIAFYEPIRPDLAAKNLAQATFVMALLWPLAALGGPARLRPWLAAVMWLATAAAAARFDADAPLVALVLGPLVGLAIWRWPSGGPKVLAGSMSAFFLLAPVLMWGVKRSGDIDEIKAALPLSWSQRVGYWSHAVDWIGDRPLRGWGLDASRVFAPGIQLHPHDDALQIWLELGVIGALTAAVFWGLTLARLSRPKPDLTAAATATSLAAYLLFGGVNFGIWQEWWLALGALVAMLAALHVRAATEAQLSTSTPYSE